MKRYVKASIDDPILQEIKTSVEDLAEEYYGFLGYKKGKYPKPDCKIDKLDSTSAGKSVYEISIEFFTVREQDAPEIWSRLDNIISSDSVYSKYEIFKLFGYIKSTNTFVGSIREGTNDDSYGTYGTYNSIENILNAANYVSDEDYYYWLDEEFYKYCDAMDWDWDNFSNADMKFLDENPEWKQYIEDNIMNP